MVGLRADIDALQDQGAPVRTENFILIEGASESPIRGDALDDTGCICPAVQVEGSVGS